MKFNDTELEQALAEMQPALLTEKQFSQIENAMNSCHDSAELRSLEAELASMHPIELDEDQLEGLEASMELSELESYLEGFTAGETPGGLLARMEDAMDNWQKEAPAENVVEFTASSKLEQSPAKRAKAGIPLLWSSAAAVAVLASVVGVLSGGQDDEAITNVAGLSATPSADEAEIEPFEVSQELPVGIRSSNIINASNEGVKMIDEVPYKKVKVKYEEVTIVKQKNGAVLEFRVPKERVIHLRIRLN